MLGRGGATQEQFYGLFRHEGIAVVAKELVDNRRMSNSR
jgi:hypothetical protein